MSIILVGPGTKPIPPIGWGAIESIIWDYYENLQQMGYDVHFTNSTDLNEVINCCNIMQPDVVHIMYDDFIVIAPYLRCKQILYTSHYAYLTDPGFPNNHTYNMRYYNKIVKTLVEYSHLVTVNAISEEIANVYKSFGFTGKINIYSNGARDNLFTYLETPEYKNKTIYVGKIEKRKKQYKYQSIQNIDFVGNYGDSQFNTMNPNYIGEWQRETLYKNLTKYANLLLLSDGEADPLVVKEALIAGLGVVVSECSAANLDNTKPFITIIPNSKLDDLTYITNQIADNRLYCISHRAEIREYALQNFSWSKIIERYATEFLHR